MSQATETPARPAIDPVIQAKIWRMKAQVKQDAEELHLLKLCRRTKHNVHPARAALMTKFGCQDGADVQYKIWCMRCEATANLIAYGRLRGKEHTVRNPGRWARAVEKILSE